MAVMRAAIAKCSGNLKSEPFFLIALAATILVSFVSKPHVSSISWNVIAILFSQMLVCNAFEESRLLSSLSVRILGVFGTSRKLGFAMVLFTGAISMFITNDIALITMVPLTIKTAKLTGKEPYVLVVLETISANLFSAVTPFGNPQNLYIYNYFSLPASEFFEIMAPFGAVGAALLLFLVFMFSKGECYRPEVHKFEISNPRLLYGALLVFVINILAVLRIVDFRISLAVALVIFIILAPRLILKVDYVLLFTFVLFFLFTDALIAIPAVKQAFSSLLSSKTSTLMTSALLSQAISNVPTAVLLSGFTPYYRELLYGVSAGGLGTLIASLASLISYKLYVREYKGKKYLKFFLVTNFGFLAVLLLMLMLAFE
jgi:Na+/H+ antiporter NhaD/arsenite permease-like protein